MPEQRVIEQLNRLLGPLWSRMLVAERETV